jgi:hypothetical protein
VSAPRLSRRSHHPQPPPAGPVGAREPEASPLTVSTCSNACFGQEVQRKAGLRRTFCSSLRRAIRYTLTSWRSLKALRTRRCQRTPLPGGQRAAQSAEAQAILGRREADPATKKPAEETRLFVAYLIGGRPSARRLRLAAMLAEGRPVSVCPGQPFCDPSLEDRRTALVAGTSPFLSAVQNRSAGRFGPGMRPHMFPRTVIQVATQAGRRYRISAPRLW